jgi:hypothetical protein
VTSSRHGDKPVTEMLGRSLAQNSGTGWTGAEDNCPEPEILAAYFERSLDAKEKARYELHFSQCAHCRGQVLVMSRPDKAPVADQEGSRRAAPWVRMGIWPWLAPVAAALVLALVWVGRRPVDQPLAGLSQQAELRAYEDSSQSNAPAPRPSAPSPHSSAATGTTHSGIGVDRATGGLREEESRQPSKSGGRAVSTPSSPPTPEPAPPGALNGAANSRMAQAEAPVTPAELTAKQLAAPAKASRDATPDKRSTDKLIPTPDWQYLWRIRGAGFVERSTDGGATWHPELLDPYAHLIAGSAPSAQICWVVGDRGMIFRTEDGSVWRKLPPPVVASFVEVAAKDVLSAIVTSADGRKFTTSDGGQHWSAAPQPSPGR